MVPWRRCPLSASTASLFLSSKMKEEESDDDEEEDGVHGEVSGAEVVHLLEHAGISQVRGSPRTVTGLLARSLALRINGP